MPRRRRSRRVRRRRRKNISSLLLAGLIVLAVFIALAFLAGKRYGIGVSSHSVNHHDLSGQREPESDTGRILSEFELLISDLPQDTYNEVAIVIDDLGINLNSARAFMTLDPSFTLAVIPWENHSADIVSEALSEGMEVILHQPMEAHNYSGRKMRGMLYLHMSDYELRRILTENLRAYPGIYGINNHMGSAFTENRHAMKVVADVLADEDLYFLDSMTTRHSAAWQVTASVGLDTYRRDVFLDNQSDYRYMKGMWDRFIRKAKQEGSAILIAHDRKESIDFLEKRLPDLDRENLLLVPLSSLTQN